MHAIVIRNGISRTGDELTRVLTFYITLFVLLFITLEICVKESETAAAYFVDVDGKKGETMSRERGKGKNT